MSFDGQPTLNGTLVNLRPLRTDDFASLHAVRAWQRPRPKTHAGQYWRIRPEELSCGLVASSMEEFERLRSTAGLEEDWAMQLCRTNVPGRHGRRGLHERPRLGGHPLDGREEARC